MLPEDIKRADVSVPVSEESGSETESVEWSGYSDCEIDEWAQCKVIDIY